MAEALQIDSSSDPFNARSTSVYSDSLKDDARSVLCVSPRFITGRSLKVCRFSLFPRPEIKMFFSFLAFRKDLRFVTEVEEEIKNLVELANKVRWNKERLCASMLMTVRVAS